MKAFLSDISKEFNLFYEMKHDEKQRIEMRQIHLSACAWLISISSVLHAIELSARRRWINILFMHIVHRPVAGNVSYVQERIIYTFKNHLLQFLMFCPLHTIYNQQRLSVCVDSSSS